jgi:hypothetical protein
MSEPTTYPIAYAGFEGRGLALQPAGLWKGAQILCDGAPLPRKGRVYTVNDNSGTLVTIRFRGSFLDPIPRVVIGDQVIALAPPFAWYDYVVVALPLLLVAGGILGGVTGAVAAFSNAKLLRSSLPASARYVLCLVSAAGAVIVYFVLAVLFSMATGRL